MDQHTPFGRDVPPAALPVGRVVKQADAPPGPLLLPEAAPPSPIPEAVSSLSISENDVPQADPVSPPPAAEPLEAPPEPQSQIAVPDTKTEPLPRPNETPAPQDSEALPAMRRKKPRKRR